MKRSEISLPLERGGWMSQNSVRATWCLPLVGMAIAELRKVEKVIRVTMRQCIFE